MKQTWRWFGPEDKVSIDDVMQAGAEGIVTALHHVPNGEVWTCQEIEKRQEDIGRSSLGQSTGFQWDVVESLPVSEDIKQQKRDWRLHIENYKQSLRNLAACGIEIVCYNFMPVLDWTRTDLGYQLANGARCMRYDAVDFAAFDIHILERKEAEKDFPEPIVEEAADRHEHMSEARKQELASNVVRGLPGAEQGYTLDQLREQLGHYENISDRVLRQHLSDFLTEIIPVAEDLGIRMCCHPDDPPFPLLGLPRIMSSEADYRQLTEFVDCPANGITLCSGSMGVRADNDLPGMVQRLGSKIHFVHLRNVARESSGEKISFHEAAHLEGATDMVALIQSILREEDQRKASGRSDVSIPFRPDHGQEILSDLHTPAQPGYPAIGRLKGLAELRGIINALSHGEETQV